MRRAAAVVALIAFSGAVSACGAATTSTTTAAAAATTAPRAWSIVALGDSVPRGANCDCKPYPPLSAQGLTTSSHQKVTATNDSVSGTTTAGVLKQVDSDPAVMDHVRKADAVEIEVGANDAGYSSKCGTKASCYAPKMPTIEKNLTAIVRRVHEL